jgi:hypothetical protein
MRIAVTRAAAGALIVLGAAGCTVPVAGTPAPDPAAVSNPTPPPRPPGAVFDDARGRFHLVPPPGWNVDTTGAQDTAVIFADPRPIEWAGGRFRANLNVLVVPAAADLPGTVVNARQELVALTDYRSTTDERATLSDGWAAHLLGGTFRDPRGGHALRNIQLLTIRNGETVVVTGTAPADAWAGYETVFETSLRSLTVVA